MVALGAPVGNPQPRRAQLAGPRRSTALADGTITMARRRLARSGFCWGEPVTWPGRAPAPRVPPNPTEPLLLCRWPRACGRSYRPEPPAISQAVNPPPKSRRRADVAPW